MSDAEVASVRELFREQALDLSWDNSIRLSTLQDILNYANLFYSQDWLILVNESGLPFVTSDNPVTEYKPEALGFFGAAPSDCRHYWALSPTMCVVASKSVRDVEGSVSVRTLVPADLDLVDRPNVRLADQAQFVYGSADEPLRRLLNLFPEKAQTSHE